MPEKKTDSEDLYQVRLEYEAYVYARNANDACFQAEAAIAEDDIPPDETWAEIQTVECHVAVSAAWIHAIPFNSADNRTVGQILLALPQERGE